MRAVAECHPFMAVGYRVIVLLEQGSQLFDEGTALGIDNLTLAGHLLFP